MEKLSYLETFRAVTRQASLSLCAPQWLMELLQVKLPNLSLSKSLLILLYVRKRLWLSYFKVT